MPITRARLDRTSVRHFIRHYLEMVLAMVVGMIVFGPLGRLALNALARLVCSIAPGSTPWSAPPI